jgi:hypothetical protein
LIQINRTTVVAIMLTERRRSEAALGATLETRIYPLAAVDDATNDLTSTFVPATAMRVFVHGSEV